MPTDNPPNQLNRKITPVMSTSAVTKLDFRKDMEQFFEQSLLRAFGASTADNHQPLPPLTIDSLRAAIAMVEQRQANLPQFTIAIHTCDAVGRLHELKRAGCIVRRWVENGQRLSGFTIYWRVNGKRAGRVLCSPFCERGKILNIPEVNLSLLDYKPDEPTFLQQRLFTRGNWR